MTVDNDKGITICDQCHEKIDDLDAPSYMIMLAKDKKDYCFKCRKIMLKKSN